MHLFCSCPILWFNILNFLNSISSIKWRKCGYFAYPERLHIFCCISLYATAMAVWFYLFFYTLTLIPFSWTLSLCHPPSALCLCLLLIVLFITPTPALLSPPSIQSIISFFPSPLFPLYTVHHHFFNFPSLSSSLSLPPSLFVFSSLAKSHIS